jgi:predicted acetyltransferase
MAGNDPRMALVWPSLDYLPGYLDALDRGWSPENARGPMDPRAEKDRIGRDPAAFIASLVDREARGGPIVVMDGSTIPRLPGYTRWMWDGEFSGTISLRWQPGTEALPSYCLGHIGYMVIPWKRRRGYATLALGYMLEEAKAEGLRHVEITARPDNLASRRVIEANGGIFVEEFVKLASLGGGREVRYRVNLS